jgi:hypothetical protein
MFQQPRPASARKPLVFIATPQMTIHAIKGKKKRKEVKKAKDA